MPKQKKRQMVLTNLLRIQSIRSCYAGLASVISILDVLLLIFPELLSKIAKRSQVSSCIIYVNSIKQFILHQSLRMNSCFRKLQLFSSYVDSIVDTRNAALCSIQGSFVFSIAPRSATLDQDRLNPMSGVHAGKKTRPSFHYKLLYIAISGVILFPLATFLGGSFVYSWSTCQP